MLADATVLTRVNARPAAVALRRLFAQSDDPDYTFNGVALRYQDAKTGKFVSAAELQTKRDQIAAVYQERMAAVGRSAETQSPAATVSQLTKHATNANILGYTLGRGGIAQMSEDDWANLGEINQRTRARIAESGFSDPTVVGGWSEDQRAAFAGYHAGDSVAAFEQGRASMYGVKLPAHPGDGTTPCGGHCRCHWDYTSEPGANGGFEYVAYWRAIDDGRTCPVCAARESEWAPYHTGVAGGPNSCAFVPGGAFSFAAPVPSICKTPPPAWAPGLPESQATVWLDAQGGGVEGYVTLPQDWESLGASHGQAGLAQFQGAKAGGVTVFDPEGKLIVIHPSQTNALSKLADDGGQVTSPLYGSQPGTVQPVVSPVTNPANGASLVKSVAAYKKIPESDVTFEMLRIGAKKGGHDGIVWDDGSITPLGTAGKLVVKLPDPPAPAAAPAAPVGAVPMPPVVNTSPTPAPTAPTGVHPVTNGVEWQPVMSKPDALEWAGKKKDGYGVEFWVTHDDYHNDADLLKAGMETNPFALGSHQPPFGKDVVTMAWSKDGAHTAYAEFSGVPIANPKQQPAGSEDIAFVTTVKTSKIVTWPQAEKMINAGLIPHIEHDYDGFVKGVKGAGYEAFEYKPSGNKNTYLSVFDPQKVVAVHHAAPPAAGAGQAPPVIAPSVSQPASKAAVPKKSSGKMVQLDLAATHQAAPGESVPRPVSKAAREAYAAGRIRRNTRSLDVGPASDPAGRRARMDAVAQRAVPAQDFIRRKNLAADKTNKKWELDTAPLRDHAPTVGAKKEVNKALARRMYEDDAALASGLFEWDSRYTWDNIEQHGTSFRELLPARLRADYDDQLRVQAIGLGLDGDDPSSWGYKADAVHSIARTRIADRFAPDEWAEFGARVRPAVEANAVEKKNMQKFMTDKSDEYVRSWAGTSFKGPLPQALQYAAQEEFNLGTVGRKVLRPDNARSPSGNHGSESAIQFKARFTRQMYNETQARLEAAGIDRVTLFRGHGRNVAGVDRTEITRRSKDYWVDGDAKGEVMLQGISSFSSSAQVASRFWGGTGAPYLVADVPREMILGTARTGFGCLNEEEFVVLGGRLEVSLLADGESYDLMKLQENYIPQNAAPSNVPLLAGTNGVPLLKSNAWAPPADDDGFEDEV